MRTSIVAGSALAALVLAAPLHAQLISADVVVRSGPVHGHVVINDPHPTHRHKPVVVYERPTRVIVVERFRHHHHHRDWKRHGYRPIKVYYVGGRYYDRWRPGVREVVVYERGGRYYRDCDDCDRYDRRDRRDHRDDKYRDRRHDRRRD